MAPTVELSISERVRVPKTAELVAQVIRSQIVRGELAERGAKAHAKALRTKLAELRALQGDPSAFLTGALEFNHAVLELAGNRTLTVLAGVLSDIVALHLATVARDWETQPRHAREAARVVDAMERLIELIAAGDGDAAERFWREQMEQSARYSLDHYGRETVVDLLG